MTAQTRRDIGAYLVEHLDVIEDVTFGEAVEAWSIVRGQRDQARRASASLEAEVAEVRALHRPVRLSRTVTECPRCFSVWPCDTARAVYLPEELQPQPVGGEPQ